MEVICLEDQAFYSLVEKVVANVLAQQNKKLDKWVSGEEAMRILRITAKSTLQKFRDEGKIKFSQPEKKIILYDTDSIFEFLEKHSHKTF
ncbi:MAG: helix-turn-helix domain-containing protein [Bacteroidota bacterium]